MCMIHSLYLLTCNERVATFCNKLFLAIILLQCFISGAIAGIVLGVLLVIAVVVGISAIIVPMVVKRKKEVGEHHYTVCEYTFHVYVPKCQNWFQQFSSSVLTHLCI